MAPLTLILVVCGLLAPAPAGAGSLGVIDFVRNATAEFDRFIAGATPAQIAAIRDRYAGIRGYAPFFDQALAWSPPALQYQDAYAIYRDEAADQKLLAEHPDWVLRDAAGRPLFIPFACNGTSCSQYAADFGNPAWRAHWIAIAKRRLDTGYAGVFVDDVNLELRAGNGSGADVRPIDPRTSQPMTDEAWRRYMAEFLEQIRAAMPAAEIAHNSLWWLPHGDPYVQREVAAADITMLERGFNDPGVTAAGGTFGFTTLLRHVDWLHALGKRVALEPYVSDPAAAEFAVATYLLVKSSNDTLSSDYRADPDDWWHGWSTDLGAPRGNYRPWRRLWRRRFSRGMVLVNPPGRPVRTVSLKRPMFDLRRRPVRKLKLGPASARLLFRKRDFAPR